MLEEDIKLPEEFVLLLRTNSSVGRRCRKIWHLGPKVGIRFVSAMGDSPRHKGSGVWAAE